MSEATLATDATRSAEVAYEMRERITRLMAVRLELSAPY